MKPFKLAGWFYLFAGICSVALVLLYQDLSVSLIHLAVYAGGFGYIIGMVLYSFSGLIRHCIFWLIDYRNYRYYYRNTSRRKPLVRLRVTPLSR